MESVLLSRQLEYFVVTYQTRNIARAAKEIPITYQGLKKALTNLESDLGVKLFDSHENNALVPTREADLVYEFALRQMSEARKLESALASKRNEPETIEICAAMGVMAYLGYDLLGEFDALHPDLHLEVAEAYDADVDALIASGRYAFGIAVAPFPSSFVVNTLDKNGCIAYVNLDSPLSEKDVLRMEDLAGHPLMIPNRQVKAHRFFRETLERSGIEPSFVTTCPDPMASYLFAKEGQGIGISVEDSPIYGAPSDPVKTIPVEDGYDYTFGAAWLRSHQLTDQERAVLDFLRERVARLASGHENDEETDSSRL